MYLLKRESLRVWGMVWGSGVGWPGGRYSCGGGCSIFMACDVCAGAGEAEDTEMRR